MSRTEGRERLVVFARAPSLKRVKTRLASLLTPGETLALHRALVEDTLERLGRGVRPDRERWLYLSETTSERFDADPGWQTAIQAGDDLGQRLEQAFREAFADERDRVVIVGSDSPTLPVDFVNRAFHALNEYDAVLGPSDDGGYYLIGASRFLPEVFRGIDWGSARVLEQTTRLLREAGRSFHILPAWYDVDTATDLQRLREELDRLRMNGDGELPRRSAAVVSSFFRKEENTS